ncbi:MAG: hypothetical protein ACXVAN_01590 [Polyangia bacterium]
MRASHLGALVALGLTACNFVLDGVQLDSPMDPGDLGAGDDLAGSDLASATGDLALPPDLIPAGALSGSIATTADASDTDLTTEGALDWSHWGEATATSHDRKNLATALISDFTNVGGTPMAQLGTYGVGFTWSDGTPTGAASNTTTGVYTYGNGAGFRISAPADTTTRTLKLYVGGQSSTANLVAHLSDGSAPDYTVSATLAAGDRNNQYERTVTLTYRAASAGQTIRVDWLQSGAGGFVHLHAATLH